MADYSSPPLQDGGELGQMASTTSASGRLLQSDCNVPDSLVSAASPSGHLLQMECKGPDPLVSAATHSGHILQTECRVADPLVSAATPSGHLLHMECDVPDPLVSATSPSGHLLQMECDVPDPLVSPTSPADHVLQTECKVPDPLVSAASPSGHLLQLECNVPDPLVSAASSSGHLLQMECDMPDPLVSAASPSAHLLQMECSVPDPVVSCHEFPNQGPALPKDLQEQGPVLPKDLGEQEEQTLPKGKPKHGPTLSLQTPVASAIHTMSLLQPDDLLVSEISSRLTTEVASFGLERTSVGEDAQATKSFPLDEALGKASDPLELHLPLTSDTSEKTFVGSELCKKILSSVTETSEVPGRSSAETDKSTDPIAATTEKLGSVVGATSHEKSIGIAGSELSVSVAKCVSVVSAQTDKPLVGAKSSEEYPSDSSLLSEQTPSNVVGQLQKSSAIDWVSTQPCLTLDTVEDSHLLKPFSLSEDELVSPLDSMKKSTSQPVASSDQSTLPPVSKDVISPLPSTKNSSSVITVDKKLPCSSSQSSENDKSTSVLPLQKDELPPGVSGSSGSQDIQECFQVRSKSHDNTCDTENGCELNLGADVSSEDKIVSEGLSCMNRMSEESEVVNSEQEMQADEPGECWNDVDSSREAAASGTLPLIVDTHTLSQADDEHSSVITNSVAHSNLISSSVLSSPQSGASNVDTVPLLETEPLQPVTIGSSLQPLEEVQEASVLDDPSFAADLALIDSSADEADSIGGLVINSVIGAADGVVDFHPDEEMETDRELTDISASAPQIVEGSCDNDSSDETGPSAKRMRFENGISDSEDKVQGTKKVIIKVTPVKNGHGLWDAHKLQEILLAKGTILLRLHASTDSYEMFEPDKDEKEVDFTGIIAEAKDEEHDHILGLANLEPDADVYDPLAIGATHASEHASPPHYNRPFPHSRGRSTALQPAMSRPGFRHLQSPPHPHYYMKHEVLGLPPPLEFEEPQLGTADWSGTAPNSMMSYELQNFLDSPTVEPVPFLGQNLQQPQERVKDALHMVKVVKVCEECGKTFERTSEYLQHINLHKLLQQCEKCNFKTKDKERFKLHMISHDSDNLKLRCNICHELFVSPISHRIHKRKIHSIFECKHCSADFMSDVKWKEHKKKGHKKMKFDITSEDKNENSNLVSLENPVHTFSDKMQLVCRLCNKETRNKYQLKIHVAQHLGVSSDKISDDDLIADIKPFSWEGGLLSPPEEPQEQNNQSVVTNKSMESVLQNLFPSENINVAAPQDEKSIDSSFFPSRIQFCDVRPKKEDTVSPESPRSTGNIKTDSLPSTLLPQPPGETGSVQTKISEESEHQCQDTPPAYRKRRVKSRRRFRPLIPCNHCSSAFTTNTALRNHKKRKHMKRPQCPACNMTKTSSRKLFQHQIKAHRNKFRCHFYCLALFDTREEQAAHHLAVHKRDDSKHICRYCKEEYPRGAYIKHLEECKEVPVNTESVSCNFCESSFCTDCEFTDHTKHCGPWKLKNKENNSDLDSPEKLSVQTSTKADTNTPSEIINQNVTQSHNKRKTRKNDYMNRKPKPKEREKIFKIPINKEEAQESQKKHLDASSHSVESMLESGGILQKCKFCPNTFDNSEDGISHVLSQHKTLLFATKAPQICHICNKSFISSLSYCKHIVKHYGELGLWDALVPSELDIENIRMNCWICKTAGMKYHRYHVTTRDKTIEKYLSSKACKMSSAKEGKIYHCSVCEESFPCRYSFWNHIKVHLSKSPFKNAEGGKYFKCVKCPMRFKKKSELLGHLGIHLLHSDTKEDEGELKTINKSKNFKRDLENKNAQDDTNEEHDKDEIENIWLEENVSDYKALPHRCKRCHKRFAKKEDALKHVVTTHKSLLKMMGETHVCHICDKTFMKPMVLCAHLLKHYSELNMWDDLVPKNLLEQTQDRRFCWICKNMLGRKASKHIHKRNNYIERVLSNKFKDLETDENFKCSLCNYACSNRYTYWKHIMLHMYKVPKKRKQKDVLAESPGNSNDVQKDLLECSECLCKFKEKSELNRHLASHFLLPFVQIDGKWKSDHSQSKDSLNSLSENHDNNKLQTVSAKYVEKKGKGKVEPQFISSIKKRTVAVRKSRPISNNDTLKCIRCFKTFENNEEAVKHVLSSHKFMLTRIVREPLTCTVCGAVFKSEWWLCRHISRHYSELGMWNALVPRDLLNKINLRNQCWICNCKLDKKYADHTSKRNIQIEKLLLTKCKKKEDIFNCSICNDTYRNRLEYWKHIKIHLCKPPVQYRSLNELLSTTCNSADDKEKVLECSDCSLSFNDEPELYAHLATHFLEHVSEQSNYNSESEQTEDEISETNFSDDEEWLPSSKTFERRKDRHNTREFISKREGESSLLAKKGCVNEVSSKDKDKNGLIDEDKNKVNDEAKSERNDEGNVNDKNESSWLEKVKPANSLGEDSDDELEETYEIGIDTDNDVGIGTDNEVGICTDNDFEIGTDNEFEIGTDDEFEIGTDNEFEIGTDDENENYTQY